MKDNIKREPSVHISQSQLEVILTELIYDNAPGNDIIVPKKIKDLANEILLRGMKHSLSNRNLLVSNDRHAKQVEKITKASLDYTLVMAKIIYQVRKSKRHRGIEMSKPGSRDWPYIKNITKNALEFADDQYPECADEIHIPFKHYIEEAMKDMKTFTLAKVQSMHSIIMENYAARIELAANKDGDYTERAFKEYNRLTIDRTGVLLIDYKDDPKEYKYFMEAAKECKKLMVTPEHYINAQFDGLSWANAIPQPKQLIGVKAKERLQKYVVENKIQLGTGGSSEEASRERVNKLKNLKQK